MEDLFLANKVLKYVKNNPTLIKFKCLDLKSLRLLVHCDASFNNLPSGGSQGAFIILLVDSEHSIAPISWSSTKIRRIARSTVTAETLALLNGCDAAFYYSKLLSEILGLDDIAIEASTDNKSLLENIHSSKATVEKKLIVDVSSLREMANKGEVFFSKVDGYILES